MCEGLDPLKEGSTQPYWFLEKACLEGSELCLGLDQARGYGWVGVCGCVWVCVGGWVWGGVMGGSVWVCVRARTLDQGSLAWPHLPALSL